MGGGLFGRQTGSTNQTQNTTANSTSQVQIPAWLENAARQNMARADAVAQIGYVPYSGPDVAALTPMQLAAMQNTGQAASAFGLASSDPTAGLPQAMDYGGVQGYSSLPMFEQALAQLAADRPGQYAALMAPFINPQTGAAPGAPFGSLPANITPERAPRVSSGVSGSSAARPSTSGRFMSPEVAAMLNAQGVMSIANPTPFRDVGNNGAGMGNYGAGVSGTNMTGGGGGLLGGISASLPGGVNSPFGGGLIDRVAAALSPAQGAPTSASRPAANPRR